MTLGNRNGNNEAEECEMKLENSPAVPSRPPLVLLRPEPAV